MLFLTIFKKKYYVYKRGVLKLNAKQYLKQLYRLDDLIKSNQKELKELKELSTTIKSVNYEKERVQESGADNNARYTKIVDKIIDLENAIMTDINNLLSLKKEIRGKVESVQDADEKSVLRCMYINFMNGYEICDELGMSKSTLNRIHKRALKNFAHLVP